MDHTLEDSLNMESIESMDFDHSAVVVNQADITLENSHEDSIAMDMDTIEEQPPLLESGHEEVIVSDFMGEQFSFQEYTLPEDNSSTNITIDTNQMNSLLVQNATKPAVPQHNIVKIKALPPQQRAPKKIAPAAFPRQVAIAPKPMKGAPNVQYAIAPKPVAVVVNKGNVAKSIPMKNVIHGSLKGNTVLTQIGKQLVMVPSSAVGQKIKLTSLLQPSGSSESSIDLNKMISNKLTSKPMQAKLIVQGSNVSESSEASGGVLTKLVPVSGAPGHATYVMQQKTIPITIAQKKMLMTSPKPAPKVVQKKQVIAIKPQMPTTQENVTTKKVVISANPSQSVVIRPINKTATAQTVNRHNVTQLHPINVPGKGIQLIKLVSSQSSKSSQGMTSNYVIADNKGNIIQVASDKMLTSHPPMLVSTASALTASDKAGTKKKLVRIAPITAQKLATTTITPARSSQSLLAPIEKTPAPTVSLEQLSQMVSGASMPILTDPEDVPPEEDRTDTHADSVKAPPEPEPEPEPELEEPLADQHIDMHEVEIQCDNTPVKREPYMEESSNSMDHESVGEDSRPEQNVIIVPASFEPEHRRSYDDSNVSNSEDINEVNVQTEILRLLSPKDSENYLEPSLEMEARPESAETRARKPCNCAKSECLKLYCDCFASGEFCNGCNCNNCLNNLQHEEQRQRAIRSCLDRNPNAFRPKIGKGKTVGPVIIRRHNKGCNCKRSGCLKNYCECYEAKIACTAMCKCVGCRNVNESLQRRRAERAKVSLDAPYRPPANNTPVRHACHMVTHEVIESVAQCLLAVVDDASDDPVTDVLMEFSRCVHDIITHASNHRCC